jgi:hypothetical protein
MLMVYASASLRSTDAAIIVLVIITALGYGLPHKVSSLHPCVLLFYFLLFNFIRLR